MWSRAPLPLRLRPVALAATIGLHVAAGWAALSSYPVAGPKVERTLTLFDVADMAPPAAQPGPASASAVPPPPAPSVSTVAAIVEPISLPFPQPSPQVLAMLAQTGIEAADGDCDLSAPLQTALRSSGAVSVGLAGVPREARSVANAIMVWNADWSPGATRLTPTALDAIRTTIIATIAAAPAGCRLQPQAGPRLLTLPGAAETTVLALGSGAWRWQDLVDSGSPEMLAGLPASAGRP